tara:strand:+ start:1206 stop:1352 length:147 start_codon:yes stop_codon:yes gene_type:complete
MKHTKAKKHKFSLSLLMTMIFVAIIGILLEVALVSYEKSVAQEQISKK